MNHHRSVTDEAIRAALAPARNERAPLGLFEAIRDEIDRTPQQRGWASVRWPSGTGAPLVRVFLLLALLAALLAGLLVTLGQQRLPARVPPTDAAMFHGNAARTGVMAGPGPVEQPRVVWEKALSGPVAADMPAVVAGTVYVADTAGFVHAFRAADGLLLWSVTVGEPARSSPAVAGGLVVVGTSGGNVRALSTDDGATIWTFHTNADVRSSAAIVDGVVYIGSGDGFLYALDLATGALRWQFAAGGAITRSAAVDAGTVYVGAEGGTFTAIDAATGQPRWQIQLGPGHVSTPAVAEGRVVVASGLDDVSAPHTLFSLDAGSGEELWRFSSPTGEPLYVGAVGDGLVFGISLDQLVHALDESSGVEVWSFDGGGPMGSGDALAGQVLYLAGGDGAVYALDVTTGTRLWRVPVTGQPGAIALVGDRLYLATNLGRLVAIGP